MFSALKKLVLKVKLWYKNTKTKRTLKLIKSTLTECEDILTEKGYRSNERHYKYGHHKLYIFIHKNIILTAPTGGNYHKGTVTVRFNDSVSTLMEASLLVYCWCCCLPPIKSSKYQRYQKERGVTTLC